MRLAALIVIIYVAVFIAYCERAYQRFLAALRRKTISEVVIAAPGVDKIAAADAKCEP